MESYDCSQGYKLFIDREIRKMVEIGTFETDRLIMRRLQKADVEQIQALGTDEVFDAVPEISTPFDAAAWVDHKLNSESLTIGHVLVDRGRTNVMGFVQITPAVEGSGYYLSVGYWLGRDYWGKGYATEAVTGALAALLATVAEGKELIPVHAKIAGENPASDRVLQKCGLIRSGPPNCGKRVDDVIWYHWPASASVYRRNE